MSSGNVTIDARCRYVAELGDLVVGRIVEVRTLLNCNGTIAML